MIAVAYRLKTAFIMAVSGLSATVILLASYFFAFTSLSFMGDEIDTSPVVQTITSVLLLALIDLFGVWRFQKLNANFFGTGGWKAALWIYQGLFVALIAGANVLVGFVGVFYLIRLLTEPLA